MNLCQTQKVTRSGSVMYTHKTTPDWSILSSENRLKLTTAEDRDCRKSSVLTLHPSKSALAKHNVMYLLNDKVGGNFTINDFKEKQLKTLKKPSKYSLETNRVLTKFSPMSTNLDSSTEDCNQEFRLEHLQPSQPQKVAPQRCSTRVSPAFLKQTLSGAKSWRSKKKLAFSPQKSVPECTKGSTDESGDETSDQPGIFPTSGMILENIDSQVDTYDLDSLIQK